MRSVTVVTVAWKRNKEGDPVGLGCLIWIGAAIFPVVGALVLQRTGDTWDTLTNGIPTVAIWVAVALVALLIAYARTRPGRYPAPVLETGEEIIATAIVERHGVLQRLTITSAALIFSPRSGVGKRWRLEQTRVVKNQFKWVGYDLVGPPVKRQRIVDNGFGYDAYETYTEPEKSSFAFPGEGLGGDTSGAMHKWLKTNSDEARERLTKALDKLESTNDVRVVAEGPPPHTDKDAY